MKIKYLGYKKVEECMNTGRCKDCKSKIMRYVLTSSNEGESLEEFKVRGNNQRCDPCLNSIYESLWNESQVFIWHEIECAKCHIKFYSYLNHETYCKKCRMEIMIEVHTNHKCYIPIAETFYCPGIAMLQEISFCDAMSIEIDHYKCRSCNYPNLMDFLQCYEKKDWKKWQIWNDRRG